MYPDIMDQKLILVDLVDTLAVSDNGWVPVSDGIRFIHDYLVFKNSLFYNVEILINLKATK